VHTKKYLFKNYLINDLSKGKKINVKLAKSAKPENKSSVVKISASDKLKKIHFNIRKTNVSFYGGFYLLHVDNIMK
jgi:hypothetical protein